MIDRTHISNFEPWFVMLIVGKDDASASHLDPQAPSLDDDNNWRSFRFFRDLYLTGDTAMFYALWQHDLKDVEPAVARRFTERFLHRRSHNMVERMLPLLEADSTFVAVGALHLPGEEGVLALLEREGYAVTRLH